MKTHALLSVLMLTSVSLVGADDPAALVPRPIPGLDILTEALAPRQPPPEPVPPSTAKIEPIVVNREQAQVIYIHRRATLPAEFTKDLPTRKEIPTTSTLLQVKQTAIKIIPKTAVPDLTTSKPKN